ncbi:hypothetical protein JCM8097_007676 [Rhodosporidiobolus ruineniae]
MTAHRPRILLLGHPPKFQLDKWTQFKRDFEVIEAELTTRDAFFEALKEKRYGDFDGIIKLAVETGNQASPWNEELISLLPPSVKSFCAAGAGFDYLDLKALNARGIAFANSRGAGDTATSDLALFLILATFRLTSLSEWAARTADPETFDRIHNEIAEKAVNPRDKVLGAVGFGAIQREIVRKAVHGLGMRCVYYDVAPAPKEVEEALQAKRVDSLEELAKVADCVSVSVPYMPSTHHLIDASFLSSLRPGSRIVNTARGPVVSQDALVAALKSGHLLSVGLDVHEFEPQVSRELCEMRNVTLTTHIGGVARETFVEFERLTLENTSRFLLRGEELLTPAGKTFPPRASAGSGKL